jgi:hypothetical protein
VVVTAGRLVDSWLVVVGSELKAVVVMSRARLVAVTVELCSSSDCVDLGLQGPAATLEMLAAKPRKTVDSVEKIIVILERKNLGIK